MSRAGDEKRRENAVVEKAEKTWTEKSKKWLTNGGGGCIIFLVSSASVLRAKPNSGDLHSGSAVDSDSTCGSSILSSPTRPQPIGLRYFRGIAQLVARLVRDEEAVGSNPAAPTKKDQYTLCTGLFSSSQRDLQRRRPPPAAGTESRGWGSGQQDANAAQGMKRMLGNRNPVQGGPAAGGAIKSPVGF